MVPPSGLRSTSSYLVWRYVTTSTSWDGGGAHAARARTGRALKREVVRMAPPLLPVSTCAPALDLGPRRDQALREPCAHLVQQGRVGDVGVAAAERRVGVVL